MQIIFEIVVNIVVEVLFRWAFQEHPFLTGFVLLCIIAAIWGLIHFAIGP
jgi:hypothetical protein